MSDTKHNEPTKRPTSLSKDMDSILDNYAASLLASFPLTVLVEEVTDGKFRAIVLGLPECKAEGKTREEVVRMVCKIASDRLEKAELISLNIKIPKLEHPWMKFAGMFQDDPQFETMQADIEAYRRELDAEMEEYYRQLDAEEIAQ